MQPRHRRNRRQSATNPTQIQATNNQGALPLPDLMGDPMLENHQTESPTPDSGGTASYGEQAPRKRADRAPRGRKAGIAKPRERLTQLYMQVGLFVYPLNQTDGTIIVNSAESMANSLFDVADQRKSQGHPELYDFLLKALEANVWVTLISVHAALFLGIAVNHNMLPAGIMRLFGKGEDTPRAPEQLTQEPPRQYADTVAEQAAMLAQLAHESREQMAAAQQAGATVGYDPSDHQPREFQDPAFVGSLVERRG